MSQYSVGDAIYYNSIGVCKIIDKISKDFKGDAIEYFVVKPFYQTGDTIYLPVREQLIKQKVSALLSKKEVHELIIKMEKVKTNWTSNHKAREDEFKKAIKKHDREDLITLIRSSYKQDAEKKLSLGDKTQLDYAEKMISEEFAYALDVSLDEVKPYINDLVGTL